MKKPKRPKPIRHPNFIAAEKILNVLMGLTSGKDQDKVVSYVRNVLGVQAVSIMNQTDNDIFFLERLKERMKVNQGAAK